MINVNKLRDYLVKEYDYPAFMVEKTIDKVEKFDSDIYHEFEHWLSSGEESGIQVEGYSIRMLIDKYKMNVVGAYLTLDWLKREPEDAKKALLRGTK